ncbi:MAG: response regulator [Anaerolineae bacterium]|nr:response regulator [Anaerolineae bacterium]
MNSVLLIQDFPDGTATQLMGDGFEVTTVSTHDNPVERAAALAPDVVVIDLRLDGQNGYWMCLRLREKDETRSSRVIFLADENQRDEELALALGADGVVSKPVNATRVDELLLRPPRPHLTDLDRIRNSLNGLLRVRLETAFLGEMAQYAPRLYTAFQLLKDETSVIIHDLRAPLGAIRGYSDMLTEPRLVGDLPPLIIDEVKIIRQEARELEQYLSDMRASAKAVTQNLKIAPKTDMARNVVEYVQKQFRWCDSHQLIVTIPQGLNLLNADGSLLTELILRLTDIIIGAGCRPEITFDANNDRWQIQAELTDVDRWQLISNYAAAEDSMMEAINYQTCRLMAAQLGCILRFDLKGAHLSAQLLLTEAIILESKSTPQALVSQLLVIPNYPIPEISNLPVSIYPQLRKLFQPIREHLLVVRSASSSISLSLSEVQVNDMVKQFVSILLTNADYTLEIVNKFLLAFQYGEGEINRQPLDLRATIERALKIVHPNGIEVLKEFSEGLPQIAADETAVLQAVINLLENAVKYMRTDEPQKPKQLTLRAYSDAKVEQVVLEIEDTGPGIPEAEMPHLFTKWFRGDKDAVREHKGNGLGLSIVQNVMKQLGGSISVESVDEVGSTFRLLFPVYIAI